MTHFAEGEVIVQAKIDILVAWSATLDAFISEPDRRLFGSGTTELYTVRVLPCSKNLTTRRFLVFVEMRSLYRGWHSSSWRSTERAHGLVMKHDQSWAFLGKYALSLVPPLAEQHRIVAKVDELSGHSATGWRLRVPSGRPRETGWPRRLSRGSTRPIPIQRYSGNTPPPSLTTSPRSPRAAIRSRPCGRASSTSPWGGGWWSRTRTTNR